MPNMMLALISIIPVQAVNKANSTTKQAMAALTKGVMFRCCDVTGFIDQPVFMHWDRR